MVTNASDGAAVEDFVLDVLREAQLTQWQQQIVFDLQVRRFNHFSVEQDKEFKRIGMSPEEVRRLRSAVQTVGQRIRQRHSEASTLFIRKEIAATPQTLDPNKTVITKEQIKLMESIGEGTFAVVKRAIWYQPNGQKIDVAVKILRDVSPLVMEDLQVEAGHLLKLHHTHLIRLYGVVQQPAMMVFELCEGGSLLDRLRASDKPVPLFTTLLAYCLQIVKAMAYLEAKHCVHRDLAARNILLTKDEKQVKICDFGLMRALKENEQQYIMGPQKRVPFSWCPPESLKHRKFSHASDVWAFGVTVWELFSLGEEPWIGCRALEVLKRLDAGERLEKPMYCSQQIYDIITLCWNVNPDKRPKFSQLKGYQQQAQFNIAEVRELHPHNDDRALELRVGDKLIVTENTGVVWLGQNERTRKLGTFLRSCVFVHGKGALSTPSTSKTPSVSSPMVSVPMRPLPPTPNGHGPIPGPSIVPSAHILGEFEGNSRVSRPIAGSFIHAGHADVSGGNSWGRPESIDEIYLKNPVHGVPLQPGIQLTAPTPSPTPHDTRHVPTRTAPPPPKDLKFKPPAPSHGQPSGGKVVDPLHPNWGDDFDKAGSPSFSPSRIEMPVITPVPSTTREAPNPPATRPTTSVAPSSGISSHRSARDVWAPSGVAQNTSGSSASTNRRGSPLIFPTGTGIGTVTMPPSSTKHGDFLVSSQTARNSPPTVLGNGVTRAPVTIQPVLRPTVPSSQPDSKRKANHTPPPVNANAFTNQGSQPSVSKVLAPSRNEFDSNIRPSSSKNIPKPSVGVDKNVMAELNKRLNNGTSGGQAVRLRPVSAVNPQQQQMMVTVNSTGITTAQGNGPDPFTIPSNVHNVVQKERYNQIMEKNYFQKAAPSSSSRPHSTMGIPATQMPQQQFTQPSPSCLVPTQVAAAPKSASNNETYRAAVTQNPIMSQNNTQSSQNSAQRTSTQSSVHQTKPLTVVLPPPSSQSSQAPRPHSAGLAGSSQPTATSAPSTRKDSVGTGRSGGTGTTTTTNSQAPPVPAGTLPRAASAAAASDVDRRSRVDEEISSLLPAPSRLFYGDNERTGEQPTRTEVPSPVSGPSSTSTLSRPSVSGPSSTSTVSRPSAIPPFPSAAVPSQPRPAAQPPADPLPISLNSVLQPTRSPLSTPPVPNVAPVAPLGKTVDISSIMNAYHAPSPYVNPLAYPNSNPAQVPLFALQHNSQPAYGMYGPGSNLALGSVSALPMTSPLQRPIGFSIGEDEDIIEALDPCRPRASTSSGGTSSNVPQQSSGGFVSRANEMEILYKEASFTEPSRCDVMVNKCDGNIASALKELKMDYLVDTGIAKNKGLAFTALENHGWDLNRAAEGLL